MKRLSASRGLDIAHPLRNSESWDKWTKAIARDARDHGRNADRVRRGALTARVMKRNTVVELMRNDESARGRNRSPRS